MNNTKHLPLIHCIDLGSMYESISQIPKNKMGVILNINKYTASGKINLYYKQRLEATINLYKSDKIEFISISLDHLKREHDQAYDFINDLIDSGIPENKIYLEYNNFKSLESLIKVKRLFELKTFTVIS